MTEDTRRRTILADEFNEQTAQRVAEVRQVAQINSFAIVDDALWLIDILVEAATDAVELRQKLRTTQAVLDDIRRSLKDVVTSLDEDAELLFDDDGERVED